MHFKECIRALVTSENFDHITCRCIGGFPDTGPTIVNVGIDLQMSLVSVETKSIICNLAISPVYRVNPFYKNIMRMRV